MTFPVRIEFYVIPNNPQALEEVFTHSIVAAPQASDLLVTAVKLDDLYWAVAGKAGKLTSAELYEFGRLRGVHRWRLLN